MRTAGGKQRRLYLPAVSIITVVLLLFVVIGVSTYRNLDRQKKTVLSFLQREAATILRSLEAGARTGMMMHQWENDAVENLIRETVRDQDIAYIYLFSYRGIITHHSDDIHMGNPAAWTPELDDENATIFRVVKRPGRQNVFELAKLYTPMTHPPAMGPRGHMMTAADRWRGHSHAGETIVIGMDMAAYEAARQSDLHHAVIMAVILLSLGSGAIFFLFVIQNYYLVNRTLKETRHYAQLVVDSMANGLLSIDQDGHLVSYNQQALNMLDIEVSRATKMNLRTAIDFRSTGIDAALLGGLSVLDQEVILKRKSGQRFPVGLTVSPLTGEDGSQTGAVLILRDLTEIKQLEEKVKRSEKMAAVGRLAAGIAHEIRNPLSSIRGLVHFLKKTLSGRHREEEYANIIVQEIDRINGVISDLLVFSKPGEADLKPVDASALIAHALKLVIADADAMAIHISSETTSCETPVLLDFNQMTQVLLNLLLNSIQAVGHGGAIKIGARCGTSPTRIRLWVEDNGPGIPDEKKAKIFDPFFTSREEGTGLGLAIVNKIIENHNGEIWITSPLIESSRGFRIDIRIPAVTMAKQGQLKVVRNGDEKADESKDSDS